MAASTKQKTAAAKASDEETEAVEAELEVEDIGPDVVRLRDEEELAWSVISEQLGKGQGKVMLAYMFAKVQPKDRITAKTDEELAAKVVTARDEHALSWGQIMARTGLSEGKCRKLYESASGQSTRGHRIGKGGRYPLDGERPEKVAKAPKPPKVDAAGGVAKSARAKKAAEPTKAEAGAPKLLADMTFDELKARLTGKKITVAKGSGTESIQVNSVIALKDGAVELTGANGGVRTITVTSIRRASK